MTDFKQGYLGHSGPTVCAGCKTPRPPKSEAKYWGFACIVCTKILCEDCGKKDGMVLANGGFHPSMACTPCIEARGGVRVPYPGGQDVSPAD